MYVFVRRGGVNMVRPCELKLHFLVLRFEQRHKNILLVEILKHKTNNILHDTLFNMIF